MKEENKKIKLPWKVYKEAAYQDMLRIYPGLKNDAVFMRKSGYEPDCEVYDIPDYVEFSIE